MGTDGRLLVYLVTGTLRSSSTPSLAPQIVVWDAQSHSSSPPGDLSDLQSQAQSEDEKAEMPLGALAAVGLAVALVAWFGKAAVMWVVVGGTVLSIGSAFIFVEGRSAAAEELQEERDGYQSPLVQMLLARLRRQRRG